MKKYIRNKLRNLMLWYVPMIAHEVKREVVRELVSRVTLNDLEKAISDARAKGFSDYSLLADIILKISKY